MMVTSTYRDETIKPKYRKRKRVKTKKVKNQPSLFEQPKVKQFVMKVGDSKNLKKVSNIKTNTTTQVEEKLGKIIFWAVIAGVFGFLYITHVFNTQTALAELSQVQAEYERVNRTYEYQALNYERLSGPAEVYRRARILGFTDSSPADHVIILER